MKNTSYKHRDFWAFKVWCWFKGLKPSNPKALDLYLKRGIK